MPEEERITFQFNVRPITLITEAKTPNSKNGWTFLGTYEKKVWTAESSDYGFSALNPNDNVEREFTRFKEGDYILPLHCYLNYSGGYAPAPVRRGQDAMDVLPDFIEIRLVDLPSDAVTAPQARKDADRFWYTLDGCRLDNQPAQHGLYINKGKRVMIMH